MSEGVLRWIGLLVCDIVALVQTILIVFIERSIRKTHKLHHGTNTNRNRTCSLMCFTANTICFRSDHC